MENLKKLYGDKAMTYAELTEALKESKGVKLANLASGQYVDKGKLDGKIGELATANQTIKELQDAVKKFDGVDVETLKKSAADWEAKYNTDVSNLRLHNALDMALIAQKARNPKLVKAALDLESIKLDGDNVLGLDEQITKIKESDPYLFSDDKQGENNDDDKNKGDKKTTLASGRKHGGDGGDLDDKVLRQQFGLD